MSSEALTALDVVINKARTHFYKPIQIAEILYRNRLDPATLDMMELETYRTASRHWRDDITDRLIGTHSTSSADYQDAVFSAVPPRLLAELAEDNRDGGGIVESYIYNHLAKTYGDIGDAYLYLTNSDVANFFLCDFLEFFEQRPGLRRSVDKAYEIAVYALFSSLVSLLEAQVSLTMKNPDPGVRHDFEKFIRFVLGLSEDQVVVSTTAELYRVGATNAADKGLDIVTNYGPVVQVKHVRLTEKKADDIVEGNITNDLVIVCKTTEARVIQSVMNQVGVRVRGVITQADLEEWYFLCQAKYADQLGQDLLNNLRVEFLHEFPAITEVALLMAERGYSRDQLQGDYVIVGDLLSE